MINKNKFIVLLLCFLLIMPMNLVYSLDLSYIDSSVIRSELNKIGLKKEYSNNIVEYIEDLHINEDDIDYISSISNDIIGDVDGKKDIDDFSINEIYSIYTKSNKIADRLGLELDYSIFKKEIEIKNKKNNNILLRGNTDELKVYMDNINSYVDTDKIAKVINTQVYKLDDKKISEVEEKVNEILNNNENISQNTENKKIESNEVHINEAKDYVKVENKEPKISVDDVNLDEFYSNYQLIFLGIILVSILLMLVLIIRFFANILVDK